MFAHDLGHRQIEYFKNAIELNSKDRAKPPVLRGCAPAPRRAIQQIFNLQYSIFNSGLPGLGTSI